MGKPPFQDGLLRSRCAHHFAAPGLGFCLLTIRSLRLIATIGFRTIFRDLPSLELDLKMAKRLILSDGECPCISSIESHLEHLASNFSEPAH
jgi:hypothetical protein